jgi:hypothetical protein
MNPGERILCKFFRPRRERPSPGAESSLVTKTEPRLESTLKECPLWGGGGDS